METEAIKTCNILPAFLRVCFFFVVVTQRVKKKKEFNSHFSFSFLPSHFPLKPPSQVKPSQPVDNLG